MAWNASRPGRVDVSAPPVELLTPPPVPYPIRPGVDPAAALRAWRAAFDEWRGERAAWVAAGGVWPGGGDQRELAEALETPDEPWHGLLDESSSITIMSPADVMNEGGDRPNALRLLNEVLTREGFEAIGASGTQLRQSRYS
jgi:hypothetical protein